MRGVKQFYQVLQFLRRGREELNKTGKKESFSLFKSFVALSLIFLCLWAAQWQFNRGLDRSDRNSKIESHIAMKPLPLQEVVSNPVVHEWKTVEVKGTFDVKNQILLRNRYFEGVYGFQLLTKFTDTEGESFWVDCGWVKAGKDALTRPDLPEIPQGEVQISGRLRLDSSLPRGAFFAIPSNQSEGLVSKANAQSGTSTENFYLDLISGNDPLLTPAVPAQLPELSDGPHMAYALQWVFFGGLVVYGRFLIRRDVLSDEEL
jgi:cytochrome oxidase assembly protein ShyY1